MWRTQDCALCICMCTLCCLSYIDTSAIFKCTSFIRKLCGSGIIHIALPQFVGIFIRNSIETQYKFGSTRNTGYGYVKVVNDKGENKFFFLINNKCINFWFRIWNRFRFVLLYRDRKCFVGFSMRHKIHPNHIHSIAI